jgi:hypothetical protein
VILCGLDIATTSGIALKGNDGVITTQTFKAPSPPKKRAPSTVEDVFGDEDSGKIDIEKEGRIARAWEDFLFSFLRVNGVQYVAIEEVLISNPGRTKLEVDMQANFAGQAMRKVKVQTTSQATIYRLYGLNMIAAGVCSRLGIPAISVNQTTWRKAFLGNGRPKDAKHEAARMCKVMGIKVSSLDAAEAVGVVEWLSGHLNPYSARRANDLFQSAPPPGVSPS